MVLMYLQMQLMDFQLEQILLAEGLQMQVLLVQGQFHLMETQHFLHTILIQIMLEVQALTILEEEEGEVAQAQLV